MFENPKQQKCFYKVYNALRDVKTEIYYECKYPKIRPGLFMYEIFKKPDLQTKKILVDYLSEYYTCYHKTINNIMACFDLPGDKTTGIFSLFYEVRSMKICWFCDKKPPIDPFLILIKERSKK